ncbi:MAG: SDR family oxidoreductase [Gemmatimonadales bacterium]
MSYQDKTVIVTGGSRGIGEGIVRAFANAGAVVSFCDRRVEEGEALAAALLAGGCRVGFRPCDVTDEGELEAFVAGAVGSMGGLDCLVNNAGWHPPHHPIDGFTAAGFRELLELNLLSMFTACRTALPALRRSRGAIVNIASLVATIGQHHAVTYAATKGAIVAFTKALALDEAPHGVRVNSISPGNIMTPLWAEAAASMGNPAAVIAEGEAAQPLGRMGTPAEVGVLALFLAAGATFTTGVDHLITGGAELGYARKA